MTRWGSRVLALIAALLFVACGSDDEGGSSSGSERIEGGSLTVATYEPASLDPHFSSFAQDMSLERMLWRGLYRLDATGSPEPMMAVSLPDISDDGLVHTVTIRDGLLWSDDDDLVAEDFVAGILRTCNPVNAAALEALLTNLVGCDEHFAAGEYDSELEDEIGVRALDDVTIEFQLDDPQPTFANILALPLSFPSPAHLLPSSSDPWPPAGPDAPAKLAYNGPYVLTEYVASDHATLAPNTRWAGETKPTLKTLTLRFLDDLATANRAYGEGELDFANVNLPQLSSTIDEFGAGQEYFEGEAAGSSGLQIQMGDETLGNGDSGLELRLALGRAIDTAKLNADCYERGYLETTTWLPAGNGGEAPDAFQEQLGHNPDQALAHLADAGFPSGEGLPDLTLMTAAVPEAVCFSEFAQEAWRQVLGIEVPIEEVDVATYSSRIGSGDFDLVLSGFSPDYPSPESWVLSYFPTGAPYSSHGCSMPEIDERAEQARSSVDEDERLRLYKEINEIAVTNACGMFVMFHVHPHYLIKPHVSGMKENMSAQDLGVAGDWIAEAWGRSQ